MADAAPDAAPDAVPAYFLKWPSIGHLNNVVASVKKIGEHPETVVLYRFKVKLHGTNASVRIFSDGRVLAQSRTRQITPSDDNHCFAKWVMACTPVWQSICADVAHASVTVFGEWFGNGINQGDAVCMAKEKQFAVFAVVLDSEQLLSDPDDIKALIAPVLDLPGLHVLPWHGEAFTIDLRGETDPVELNAMVAAIGERDPWAADVLGIEGPGEGVVAYPLQLNSDSERMRLLRHASFLMFKAKHERHAVKQQKRPARVVTEVSASAEIFAGKTVTDARLEQFRIDVDPDRLPENFGRFNKRLVEDICTECEAELDAAKLTLKDVTRPITLLARAYWFQQ